MRMFAGKAFHCDDQKPVKISFQTLEKSEKTYKEAELLFEDAFYEAAISQAYYCMFYLTQAVLATKDIERRRHSGLISAFAQYFIKTGIFSETLQEKLSESFKERQWSDYSFDASPSRSDAARILNNAKQFSAEVVPYLHVWMEENKID